MLVYIPAKFLLTAYLYFISNMPCDLNDFGSIFVEYFLITLLSNVIIDIDTHRHTFHLSLFPVYITLVTFIFSAILSVDRRRNC